MASGSDGPSDRGAPDFDVLIVGAGIAGISAGAHLKRHCPDKSFAMLEARGAIGGTWDLFRYPGVRSDSDMYTLGFGFRPWTGKDAIARGADIRAYLADTIAEYGLGPHIRLNHAMTSARWDSARRCWRVMVDVAGEGREISARILHLCTGYYDYAAGYRPTFKGEEDFVGAIVHPQFWPDGLDVAGKRVAVIGSGATAVTLVPALAERGADVAMVQRSPGYMLSMPRRDRLAAFLGRILPRALAYGLVRARNVALQRYFFRKARSSPAKVRDWLLKRTARAMPALDMAAHMTPRYNPWEQRLCLVPDGDFHAAVNSGKARLVTGTINHFTPHGIRMADGQDVPADIIVTATGLNLQLAGGAKLFVDDAQVQVSRHVLYKGAMLDGVPNFLITAGYVNASWTLKADLVSRFLTRLIAQMDAAGAVMAVPSTPDKSVKRLRMIDFSSGYFLRARHIWPKQGAEGPWRMLQDYYPDRRRMLKDPVDDGVLIFS